MISLTTFLTIYLLGGVTFIPVVLLVVFYLYGVDPQSALQPSKDNNNRHIYPKEEYKDCDPDQGKSGWIRLTKKHDTAINSGRFMTPTNGNNNNSSNNNNNNANNANSIHSSSSSISSMTTNSSSNTSNNNSKKYKDLYYGVLKHGTLFIYESDKMFECKMIIPVHDFTVSIYPEGRRDHELFSKSTAIRLRPKHLRKKKAKNNNVIKAKTDTDLLENKENEDDGDSWALDQDFYLYCGQAIDKEDWYFALMSGSNFMSDSPTMNSKHFDMDAMHELIKNIHHDPSTRQIQWLNAILGRIFLGMYKTDKVHQFFEQKITKKVSRMKRPVFIDDISVHRVLVGHAIPYINNPKLLSLSMDGSLTAEAQVEYQGGLCVEIETGFLWTYSSRMKPIRVNLILSVTLKKLSGRLMFKIKAPPTNRYWVGFYEPPVMDLVIKPIVSDKQIKLNVVTNAIEAKIREVIADTMVLPNMDDFIFCDSNGKGGIFDDETPPPSPISLEVPEKQQPSASTSIKSEPGAVSHHYNENTKSSSVSVSSRRSSSASSPPAPRTSESMPPPARRADSAKSPEHLSVTSTNEVSKSSPDLLSGSHSDPLNKQPSGGGETASLMSQDSSDSNSSSIRWPSSMNLRRKKKRSDSTSIISTEKQDDDNSSIHHEEEHNSSSTATSTRSMGARRSFLSKLKSEISEEMRSGERKPLYQKAENIWQRSKEVTREYREQQLVEREQSEMEQAEKDKMENDTESALSVIVDEHDHDQKSKSKEEVDNMSINYTRAIAQEQEEHLPPVIIKEKSRISKKPPAPPRPARRRPSSTKEEDRPPLPPRSPNDDNDSNNNRDQASPPMSFETSPKTKKPPTPPPRKAPPSLPPRGTPQPENPQANITSTLPTEEQRHQNLFYRRQQQGRQGQQQSIEFNNESTSTLPLVTSTNSSSLLQSVTSDGLMGNTLQEVMQNINDHSFSPPILTPDTMAYIFDGNASRTGSSPMLEGDRTLLLFRLIHELWKLLQVNNMDTLAFQLKNDLKLTGGSQSSPDVILCRLVELFESFNNSGNV